jgi:hypothetical protein
VEVGGGKRDLGGRAHLMSQYSLLASIQTNVRLDNATGTPVQM